MPLAYEDQMIDLHKPTAHILHKLQFGVHRLGYRQLILMIPCYAIDPNQSLSKELYPYAANHFGHTSWQPVEHAVRVAILDAWERRDPAAWEEYFPGMKKPPSNKVFIATIAEHLKNTPPG